MLLLWPKPEPLSLISISLLRLLGSSRMHNLDLNLAALLWVWWLMLLLIGGLPMTWFSAWLSSSLLLQPCLLRLMRLDLERLLHWKQNLDWANLKNLLEKFLLLMHWKPFAKSSRELLIIQIILVLLLPTVSCKTFRNVAWRASDVPMFQNTVERAARNRQVGIHPVLLILARTAATVWAFSPDMDAIEISILDCALEYDCTYTNKTYILVAHNAIYVPTIYHNLIPPFLLHEAGWEQIGVCTTVLYVLYCSFTLHSGDLIHQHHSSTRLHSKYHIQHKFYITTKIRR